jgi:hypothetical protein
MKRSELAISRRALLAGAAVSPWLAAGTFSQLGIVKALGSFRVTSSPPVDYPLTPADVSLLNQMQRGNYQFFVDGADPVTGFVPDRGDAHGKWFSDHSSSAACGFALAGHAIATQNGWVDRDTAAARTRRLLDSLLHLAQHEHGFVYHFFGRNDGNRRMQCEASSIDTALLIAGAMTSRVTFGDDAEIVALADELYARVDWQWMLGDNDLMHMGWTPEHGRLPYQWDSYSELIILVLLAIGAPNHAIPPRCWQAWRREPVLSFEGQGFLSYPPLFVHQYPMAFFDFRAVRSPSGRSYWDNAIRGHRAQIAFMSQLASRYPQHFGHYGRDLWGLTSSDSADGYRDWGGPYQIDRFEPDRGIDGTVVPSAAAGGLAIVPEDALRTLHHQRQHFGDQVFGRYGFINAYNPARNWVGTDVIGIDTGISLIMADNLRTGGVWNAFMHHPAAGRALDLAGFTAI